MTTIVDIFRRVDRQCLCLFDELGAGTDPTEGAALAISIPQFLPCQEDPHTGNDPLRKLKAYAMRTEGIVASCEFNVETLQPTYHLWSAFPERATPSRSRRSWVFPITSSRRQRNSSARMPKTSKTCWQNLNSPASSCAEKEDSGPAPRLIWSRKRKTSWTGKSSLRSAAKRFCRRPTKRPGYSGQGQGRSRSGDLRPERGLQGRKTRGRPLRHGAHTHRPAQ